MKRRSFQGLNLADRCNVANRSFAKRHRDFDELAIGVDRLSTTDTLPFDPPRAASLLKSKMMTAASPVPGRVIVPSSARPHGGAARRGAALVPRAAETTQKAKPDWAGDDVLSKVVDAAINNRVLYEGLMKPMARRTLINTAEKNGVAWRDIAARLEKDPSIQKHFDDVKNDAVEYPEYYLKPFHAYAEGNLCWLAAFEAEPATYSMALRVYPKDRITAEVAQARLRDSYTEALRAHVDAHAAGEPKTILDVGCSVGISTQYISRAFPEARMIGMDLSPYMLAVAKHRDEGAEGAERREWVHGLGEDTGLESDSVDVVSLAFVIHECPESATRALMTEAARVLKPGGTFVMTDNNPKSPVIQKLPPALFTLMKSTEPHSNEYYTVDIEGLLAECGFEHVHTVDTDPRHRTVLGTLKK